MSVSLNQLERQYEISAVKTPKRKLALNILLPVILIIGLCFIFKGVDSCPRASTITVTPNIGMQGQTLAVIIRDASPEDFESDFFSNVNFGNGITVINWVKDAETLSVNISIALNAELGPRDIVFTFAESYPSEKRITALPHSFTVMPGMIGIPTHGAYIASTMTQAAAVSLPNISVQSASISAKSVTPGTPVTVTADITNKSTVNGNKKVTLYINGQVETTQGVTVNSGGSSKLTFNVIRSDPGDYNVYVDGVPAGSFTVEMVTANDGILIFSVALLAIVFVAGMVLLWRRQQRAN